MAKYIGELPFVIHCRQRASLFGTFEWAVTDFSGFEANVNYCKALDTNSKEYSLRHRPTHDIPP